MWVRGDKGGEAVVTKKSRPFTRFACLPIPPSLNRAFILHAVAPPQTAVPGVAEGQLRVQVVQQHVVDAGAAGRRAV